jgi:hypothetical protein
MSGYPPSVLWVTEPEDRAQTGTHFEKKFIFWVKKGSGFSLRGDSLMIRAVGIAVAGAIAALALTVTVADVAHAGDRAKASPYDKRPQVRGYEARRGGYSYSYSDTINTYGDNRSVYGATQSFRDPMLDRQTNAGPFDHGFFFESGVAPRGGNAPYMH